MCKELTLLSCLLIVLSLSGGATGATLVAYWPLDNDVRDSVGGIDGTLINGPQFTTDAMVGSHALALNSAASQYVDFGNPPGLPAGRSPRSMAGWGKTDTVASGYRWLAAYGSPGTSQAMFIGMLGTTLVAGGYGGDDVSEADFWEVGVWHHICLTYDGNVARLYADGVEVDSQTKNWNLILSRAHIGRQVNDAAEFWDGLVDDIRIYDGVLSPAEIKKLAAIAEATRPQPADGAMHPDTWVNMSWEPGGYAVSHDVYLADNFDDVRDGTADAYRGNQAAANLIAGFTGFAYPAGLVPGTTYYWRVDEVNDADPNSPWKGDVWSFTVPPKKAYDPDPADGARFIDLNSTLGWTGGFGAKLHTVYFGKTFDDVDNATQGTGIAGTTYSPGALELDSTYYWRVDEFDALTTHKGDVWSFTTLPNIPVADPALVAWWKLDEGGGTTVVDWSGHGNHGKLTGDPQWTDGYEVGALDFDGDGDYVDFARTSDLPAGTSARTLCGWGRTDTVAGGWRWIAAYGTAATSQAMFIGINGTSLYGGGYGDDVYLDDFWQVGVWHHICLTYNGTTAILYADGVQVASENKTWDLPLGRAHIGRQVNNAAEFWNGMVDDVRIYSKALSVDEIQQVMLGNTKLAGNPVPVRDVVVDIRDISSLSWSAGDAAASHDVYLGQDRDAVAAADDSAAEFRGNQAGTSLSLAGLVEFGGGDYYWRVNEVESGGAVNAGTIWKFTVPDYLIVDDFESYNDIDEGLPGSNRIYLTWIDGYGTTTNGAVAGNLDVPFMSQGREDAQAMPLSYDNAGKTSEATMTLTAKKDWTVHGVTKLVIWFSGDSANAAERMFVALGNSVVYHPDNAATQDSGWNEWVIDLADFTGADLSNVTSLTIGFGTRNAPAATGGTGTVIFDDIRLIQ